jgi:hypothetical protein
MSGASDQMDLEVSNLEMLGKDPNDLIQFKHQRKNHYLRTHLTRLNTMLKKL